MPGDSFRFPFPIRGGDGLLPCFAGTIEGGARFGEREICSPNDDTETLGCLTCSCLVFSAFAASALVALPSFPAFANALEARMTLVARCKFFIA